MTPDEMAALHGAAFPNAPWSAADFDQFAANPATLVLPDAAKTGLIVVQHAADEAEILTLAVAPGYRRNGIAAALVAKAGRHLAERGIKRLFLEVGANNEAALALYSKLGFTTFGRRNSYYRHPDRPAEDALLMQVALPLGHRAESTGQDPKSG